MHIAHGNLSGQLATLGALGLIARQTGRLDEAVRHFSEVTDLAQRLGNKFAEAEITEQLADVLMLQGKNNLAAQTLRTAHDLFTRQHRTHDAERVRGRLKETYG